MKMLTVSIVCGFVLVLGCGRRTEEKAVEKAVEKAMEKSLGGGAKVNISDEGMSFQGKNGKVALQTGKSARIPKDFPSDVFILKGAAVDMAMQTPDGFMVSLRSKEEMQAVADRYKKEMAGKGWAQQTAMDMGAQFMLAYTKEKRQANVMIASADGATTVALTVSQK